ncbi:MAG: hypothetical protein VXZ38_07985, partial [Planctomycetota bacterium]|nr:hypothetical protein [Planctomycetota bacterium]
MRTSSIYRVISIAAAMLLSVGCASSPFARAKQEKMLGQASSHTNPSQQIPAMTGTPAAYRAATPASTPLTESNTAPLYDSQEFLRDGGDAEPVVR